MDDCSGELLGYTMERLLEAGALDVQYLPAFMKKNRPAWQLQVLCRQEDIERLEQIIFCETTTIGIRRCFMERSVLPRRQASVRTPYGQVQVKLCQTPQGERRYVEYASAAQLAKEQGVPLAAVYEAAVRADLP